MLISHPLCLSLLKQVEHKTFAGRMFFLSTHSFEFYNEKPFGPNTDGPTGFCTNTTVPLTAEKQNFGKWERSQKHLPESTGLFFFVCLFF